MMVRKRRKLFSTTDNTILVLCKTTVGDIYIDIHEKWSPNGAKRFLKLISLNFFNNMALYRAVPRFLIQFGIPSNMASSNELKSINDDPSMHIPFEDGTLSYAGSGPNSRTTELFFSLGKQSFLGKSPWETPFGRIQPKSLSKLHKINTEYGDFINGNGPQPGKIKTLGYKYLKDSFPKLDYILSCSLLDNNDNTNMGKNDEKQNNNNNNLLNNELVQLPFGGEQLIVHNKKSGVRGWYTDNGILFDDGTRLKHKTPFAHVLFLIMIIICLVRCARCGCCFKCCSTQKVKKADDDGDDNDDERYVIENEEKNYADGVDLHPESAYNDDDDDMEPTTRRNQKLYTYKNKRSRRRRRLVYDA